MNENAEGGSEDDDDDDSEEMPPLMTSQNWKTKKNEASLILKIDKENQPLFIFNLGFISFIFNFTFQSPMAFMATEQPN